MTQLETTLKALKSSTVEMITMAKIQLQKSKEAFLNKDQDLADEIFISEKHLNNFELRIDRDCENIFALHNPVASDLRLVIAILKVISDIERIGDHAEGIASYIIELDKKFEKDLFEQLRFTKMYDIALQMLEMLEDAFDREDLGLARKIFKLDKSLNEIKLAAPDVITDYLRNDSEATKQALFLFSTIRKLERVGDLCKNIAEQLIFYAEAKVVKHRSEK
ncbi:MAG: phosphate transport system protein [Flavobacteriales bacterium]|mgnify:FL=1|jgi:phosphate transport system protein|tara:strand:+ start:1147 stop:1809 length:663 start_codon:yes stop_codon:yes gene_type:complete